MNKLTLMLLLSLVGCGSENGLNNTSNVGSQSPNVVTSPSPEPSFVPPPIPDHPKCDNPGSCLFKVNDCVEYDGASEEEWQHPRTGQTTYKIIEVGKKSYHIIFFQLRHQRWHHDRNRDSINFIDAFSYRLVTCPKNGKIVEDNKHE